MYITTLAAAEATLTAVAAAATVAAEVASQSIYLSRMGHDSAIQPI